MGIEPQYQPLYKRAQDLKYQFHDAVGDTDHPSAFMLKQEMRHLEDDIETGRSPRDIENRIKAIQHGMMEAQNQARPMMSFDHSNHFHDHYEDMRRGMRNFRNYS